MDNSHIPLPLEGPLTGKKVFEKVYLRIAYLDGDGYLRQVDVLNDIAPVPAETIYTVKEGHQPTEFVNYKPIKYVQSIDGKIVQAFSADDFLII
jgi:hypothetical protein